MHLYRYRLPFIHYDERCIWLGLNMYLNSTNAVFEVIFARTFISRACGLLLRKKLNYGECLLITPCSSIHTIGMRYSIDVVFIDALGYITDIYYNVPPFRIRCSSKSSCSAVEFLGGTLQDFKLNKNDLLFSLVNY